MYLYTVGVSDKLLSMFVNRIYNIHNTSHHTKHGYIYEYNVIFGNSYLPVRNQCSYQMQPYSIKNDLLLYFLHEVYYCLSTDV